MKPRDYDEVDHSSISRRVGAAQFQGEAPFA